MNQLFVSFLFINDTAEGAWGNGCSVIEYNEPVASIANISEITEMIRQEQNYYSVVIITFQRMEEKMEDIKKIIDNFQRASKAFEQAQTNMINNLSVMQTELNKLRIAFRKKETEIINLQQGKKDV